MVMASPCPVRSADEILLDRGTLCGSDRLASAKFQCLRSQVNRKDIRMHRHGCDQPSKSSGWLRFNRIMWQLSRARITLLLQTSCVTNQSPLPTIKQNEMKRTICLVPLASYEILSSV